MGKLSGVAQRGGAATKKHTTEVIGTTETKHRGATFSVDSVQSVVNIPVIVLVT